MGKFKGPRASVGVLAMAFVLVLLLAPTRVQAFPIEQVSVAPDGRTSGDRNSSQPSVSGDGRYVAFLSFADNLVAGDTYWTPDVFIRDRSTDVTERVGQDAMLPSVSSNGRYVAFLTFDYSIYLRDRDTGSLELVSVAGVGCSGIVSFSGDGSQVAFDSGEPTLVPNDTNGITDAFVRNRSVGRVERVSVASDGAQANDSSYSPALSADGRFVAFISDANNLVPGDTNGCSDVFVRDRLTGRTEAVSLNAGGATGNGTSGSASISADGRYVAFGSEATNLVPGDSNGAADVFIRDRLSGTTERVSVLTGGGEANGGSYVDSSSLSGDGRGVAFSSFASNLSPSLPGGMSGDQKVYLRDRLTNTTALVSATEVGSHGGSAAISADGSVVAFESYFDLLHGGGDYWNVFVATLDVDTPWLQSKGAAGGEAHLGSQNQTSSFAGEPVNLATGNFSLEAQDHALAGFGPALAFTRTYNARFPAPGSLGYGWRHSYEVSLGVDQAAQRAVVTYADGHTALWSLVPPLDASLATGWNLIAAGPGSDTGGRVLFAYDGAAYASTTAAAAESARGYWVKATVPAAATLMTTPAPLNIHLLPGWNLIGNSAAVPVTLPEGSAAFVYRGGSYASTVTLAPGEGAWLRASVEADIVLTPAPERTYAPEPGNFAQLAKDATGSTLTEKDQTRHRFDLTGRLASITDESGNALSLAYDTEGQLTSVTDDAGRSLTFTYDPGGLLTQVEDPLGRTTTYAHDASGNLTAATDRAGATTTYAYDDFHRLTTATDPLARTFVTNEYDTEGRVTRQLDAKGALSTFSYLPADPDTGLTPTVFTNPRGFTTTYFYDAGLREVAQEDALGQTATFAYDAQNNRTGVTNKRGDSTTMAYDARGNLLTQTDALVQVTTNTYDPENHRLTQTDPRGAVTSTTYDAAGDPTSATDALGPATTMINDSRGLLVSRTDPLGHTTAFTYDAQGKPLRTTNPDGTHTDATYDLAGRLLTMTDELGHVASSSYDLKDRKLTDTDPLGGVATAVYDAAGQLTTRTDRTGRVTTMTYDLSGRLATQTDPGGGTTTYARDANGNVVSVTDATGRVTLTRYDALDRSIEVEDGLGNVVRTAYDANGNVVASTDAAGHVTAMTYDALNRLTHVTDALGGTQSYAYDAVGNRTTVTDPLGAVITTTYDLLDRPTTTTDRSGLGATSTYDAAGRIATAVDRKGQTTAFSYDSRDRLVSTSDPDGTTTYAYDPAGRRTGATDAAGTIATTYDALGRVTSRTDPNDKTVTYAYDADGRRTGTIYPDAKTTTNTYDAAGRLATVTDWSSAATTYAYDAAGRPIATTYPNGVVESCSYDAAGRLTGLATAKGAVTLQDLVYAYDVRGNRTSEVSSAGTTAYAYDALSRLASVTYPDATGESYTYDAAGNRLTKTAGADTTTYVYDAAGHLDSLTDASGSTTFTYDANGNTVGKTTPLATTTFAYDAANRTTAVDDGVHVETMTYDADGVRIERTLDGAATTFVQDTLAGDEKVLQESAGTATTSYVLGYTRLASEDAGGRVYLHGDVIGSVRLTTDAAGTQAGTMSYQAWGAVRSSSGTGGNFGFAGEQQDPFGLTYLRARLYDPALGRFLQEDPVPGMATDTQGLAAYVYCRDNPVMMTDPSGKTPQQMLDWVIGQGWIDYFSKYGDFERTAMQDVLTKYLEAMAESSRNGKVALGGLQGVGTMLAVADEYLSNRDKPDWYRTYRMISVGGLSLVPWVGSFSKDAVNGYESVAQIVFGALSGTGTSTKNLTVFSNPGSLTRVGIMTGGWLYDAWHGVEPPNAWQDRMTDPDLHSQTEKVLGISF